MGGAKPVGRYLRQLGPLGLDMRLAGLCDAREEADFRRGLERAGFGTNLTLLEMERLGFFVCEADLEDEADRGPEPPPWSRSSRPRVSWAPGERCRSSRRRSRAGPGRLSSGGSWAPAAARKIRYAVLLVEALDLNRSAVNDPDRLLAHL